MKPTKEFLKKLISDLQKQLAVIEKEELPKSVWDLKDNDECWIISDKGVVMRYHAGYALFETRRAKGDMFLTQEAAQKELAERIKIARIGKEGLYKKHALQDW